MLTDGAYQRVSEIFRSKSGKSLKRVYQSLLATNLTDEQLLDFSPTVLAAERCIDNNGYDRTTHKAKVLRNGSYKPGQTSHVETTIETINQTLHVNGEVLQEYTVDKKEPAIQIACQQKYGSEMV